MVVDLKMENQKTFANSFWVFIADKGDGDRGLQVLISRMKRSKRTSEELNQLLKERSLIEEEYGKKLAKLAKNFAPAEEIGTLGDSLVVIRNELEQNARAHLDLANDIRTKLAQPLQELIDTQGSIRKNVFLAYLASESTGEAFAK